MSDSEHAAAAGNGTAAVSDSGAKVIKRYTNRKLYDTIESRYVTLDEIAEMVKGGVDVRIIDNRTKEDLTSITLAQIIFEEEKREGQMPLGLLKRIIQTGGTAVQDFISERVTSRVGALKEEAETRVNRLFRRDEPAPRPTANVKELFTTSQRALEEWQRRVDERVRGAVEAVTGLTTLQRDLQQLNERLDQLEKKLSVLDPSEAATDRSEPSPAADVADTSVRRSS